MTPTPTEGALSPEVSDGDYAQAVLLPLSFRLHCRKDAGENVSIGQPLRRDIERALNEAADRLSRQEARTTPAGLDREGVAAAVHRGRFQVDDTPTPFEDEDRGGREYCFRIADSVLALAASPSPPEGLTDARTWWFLENDEGRWLHDADHGTFTSDPNAALKWPNSTAANDFRFKLRGPLWALRATEHKWFAPAQPVPLDGDVAGVVAWLESAAAGTMDLRDRAKLGTVRALIQSLEGEKEAAENSAAIRLATLNIWKARAQAAEADCDSWKANAADLHAKLSASEARGAGVREALRAIEPFVDATSSDECFAACERARAELAKSEPGA
jgi:hypothetical protein